MPPLSLAAVRPPRRTSGRPERGRLPARPVATDMAEAIVDLESSLGREISPNELQRLVGPAGAVKDPKGLRDLATTTRVFQQGRERAAAAPATEGTPYKSMYRREPAVRDLVDSIVDLERMSRLPASGRPSLAESRSGRKPTRAQMLHILRRIEDAIVQPGPFRKKYEHEPISSTAELFNEETA